MFISPSQRLAVAHVCHRNRERKMKIEPTSKMLSYFNMILMPDISVQLTEKSACNALQFK